MWKEGVRLGELVARGVVMKVRSVKKPATDDNSLKH